MRVGHPDAVVTRVRAADVGSLKARSIIADLGTELRHARIDHGLSQAAVGRAVRLSPSQVSRIERGDVPLVSLSNLARLLAVVGLELSGRAYPAGSPIRDAAHRALLERLRARVSPAAAWRFEVPVTGAGDQRAWDAVLLLGARRLAVEAETRPLDVQALQRRVALKRRDDPEVSGVLLLLADTRHNRALVREHGEALRADFPTPAGEILRALHEGRVPDGSGILLV